MNVRIAPARDHAIRLLISVLVAGSLGLFALSLSAGGATNPWAGVSSAAFWAAHPENDARVAEPASGVYQPNTDDDFVKHVKKAHSLVDTGKAWRNLGAPRGRAALP